MGNLKTQPTRGYYSLVQYCPDRSRAEVANVGVVLFCPERRFIKARMAPGNDRVKKLFGSGLFDPKQVNAAKKAMERRIEIDGQSFRSLDDLQQFIDTRANELIITAPRPVKVFDAPRQLDELFDELVGGRERTPREPRVPELERAFKAPDMQRRIKLGYTVQVPVVQCHLKVPYAYRNGTINLIKPQKFPRSGAMDAAIRLAVEGDLIHKNPDDEGNTRQLIVVSLFDEPEGGTEKRVDALLGEYRVKHVPRSGVDSFIEEVLKEARPFD